MSTRAPLTDKSGKKKSKVPKLSRLSKPAEMTLEEWQIELRKQFGADAALSDQEPRRSSRLFRVPGQQSRKQEQLSRPHSRQEPGRQRLHLPRFRHQHARHLQAHRIHAGQTRTRPRIVGASCATAICRNSAKSTSNMALAAKCVFGRAANVPPSCRGWLRTTSTMKAL